MRINLNLRQLEAFLLVATHGSFRKAGAHVNLSQPAISRLIKQAEDAVGRKLFDRDTRNVRITPIGAELLPIAQRILRDFDDSLGDLGQFMAGQRGRVSMAALPSVCVAWLASAVAAASYNQDTITYSIREAPADRLLAWVEDGTSDFVISMRPDASRPFRYKHLLDDHFVLLCPRDHVLASCTELPWSAFGRFPFVAAGSRSSIRKVTDAVLLQISTSVTTTLEYSSVSVCGALVAEGVGLTALPKLALGLVDMSNLTAIPLTSPRISRPLGVITRAGRTLSPATDQFIKNLGPGPALVHPPAS